MANSNFIQADRNNTVVILPVFNSASHLNRLIPDLLQFFPKDQIFAVNDGSSDNSSDICHSFQIKTIDFDYNLGKGAALWEGIKKAMQEGYLYAFSLDSDEQHLPEHIPQFFNIMNSTQAGLVIGNRDFNPDLMPWQRILSNQITSLLVSISFGQKIPDSQCGYRLYSLTPLKKFMPKTLRYQFETEILLHYAQENVPISSTPIKTVYADEISYINHLRDIWNFVAVIFKYWFSAISKILC